VTKELLSLLKKTTPLTAGVKRLARVTEAKCKKKVQPNSIVKFGITFSYLLEPPPPKELKSIPFPLKREIFGR
jgi:hypothetical protein